MIELHSLDHFKAYLASTVMRGKAVNWADLLLAECKITGSHRPFSMLQ